MTDIKIDPDNYREICKLKNNKFLLLLIMKLITFIAFYQIIISGWHLFNVYRVTEWQPVNAIVIHKEVEDLPNKGMTYIDFRYSYKYKGKEYTSKRVGRYPIWIGKQGILDKIRGIKEKDKITVFIDPDRPNFVYFDNDLSAYRLQFYMLFLYIFIIFAFDAWVGGASILKLKKELKELANDPALD